MKDNTTTVKEAASEKPGVLKRMFIKLDESMKQKADEKSQQSSCCGGKDDKGKKCC